MGSFDGGEVKFIEQSRVALQNASVQVTIANFLAEVGYTADVIAQGQTVWQNARDAYDLNQTEDMETSLAYKVFTETRDEVSKKYKVDRKKAKVIFRNDDLQADALGISQTTARTYAKWYEQVRKFYITANADADIKTALGRLMITEQHLSDMTTALTSLENSRADYLREVGESQDSTTAKDAALGALDDWMSDFYAVAKIALEDQPQLLESLSKMVRS